MRSVFFIGSWADYEDLFFDVPIEGYDVKILNIKNIKFFGLSANIFGQKIKKKFIKSKVQDVIEKNPDGIFFFQNHKRILDMMLDLYDERKDFRIIFRDIVAWDDRVKNIIINLKYKNLKIYSFDSDDCERYGFIKYDNFIKKVPGICNENVVYDVVFIGRDKDRLNFLQKFRKDIETVGYSFDISILGVNLKKKISYIEYLKKTMKARAIIDFVQDGQTGLTLRPIESIFYNKKLITNNRSILAADFYNENNIFFIEKDFDVVLFDTFMKKPYIKVSEDILRKYSSDEVIGNIIRGN